MPASSSSQIAAGPKIHQLWQAVILKPFKLQECILHFWKPLIFINLVSAGQDHSYVLNTRFWLQKRSTFHRACVIGVYILFSMTVPHNGRIPSYGLPVWRSRDLNPCSFWHKDFSPVALPTELMWLPRFLQKSWKVFELCNLALYNT